MRRLEPLPGAQAKREMVSPLCQRGGQRRPRSPREYRVRPAVSPLASRVRHHQIALSLILGPQRNGLTGAPFSQKIVAMTSRISHTTVDAIDAYAQSVWWSKVLDFIEDADDPNEPGHELCPIMSRDRSQVLLFITVPDGQKKLKNRLHFDLRPVDGTRDEEVERLLALGASHVGDFRRADGRGWITLTDPEGNEFCVLPPDQATSNPIS